jgi:hypothetical protein
LKQLSPGAAGRREAHRETVGDGETKLSAGGATLIYPHHRQRRKAILSEPASLGGYIFVGLERIHYWPK